MVDDAADGHENVMKTCTKLMVKYLHANLETNRERKIGS